MDAPPPVGQLPLCRGCGVVAPLQQGRCQVCQRELESPRWWVPVAEHQLLWAQVRASFECRACGHRSAIDHLDIDGSVQCLSCGIEQRFENKQWWAALEQAHAVADLTGPHAEGLLPEGEISIAQVNPHAALGVTESEVEVERGEQSLRLAVSPGKPVCEKCRGLLVIGSRADGKLSLGCPTCAVERRYALPKNLSQRLRALQAVVAAAHEEGRLDAVLREEGGVTALRCPTCGAALSVDGSNVVTCQYCQTSSRVDARARSQATKNIEPTPFWLLFEGPSAQRGKLQNRAEAELNKQRKDNQRAAQQRAQARAMDRPREVPQDRKWSSRQKLAVAVALVVSLGVTALALKVNRDVGRVSEQTVAQGIEQVRQRRLADESAERERRTTDAVQANPGKPFSLNVTMDVVKAEGQSLKPGAPCVVYASGFDDSVKELHVSCGSALLYNSTAQVMGMRMMEHELLRSESDQSPIGLRYNDTGQRTGGAEISLDTKLGQGVISSQTVPIFRVELGLHQEAKAPTKSKPKPTR